MRKGRLLNKDDPDASGDAGAQVTYARSLDGRRLWLAIEGAADEPALLAEPSGVAVPLEDVAEVEVGERTEACVPLDDLWERVGRPARLEVVITNAGSPVPPAADAAIGDDGSTTACPVRDGWRTDVTASDDDVRVVRTRHEEMSSRVRSFSLSQDSVRILFDTDLAEPHEVVFVDPSGERRAAIPVGHDGSAQSFVVDSTLDLEPGVVHQLRVGSADGSTPLVRDRNGLRRPGTAVGLPKLWSGGADAPRVLRLRYLRGGRLAAEATMPTADAKDPS